MSSRTLKDVLICDDVSVRFPLMKSTSRWHLFFGSKSVSEWHDALSNITLRVPKGKIVGVIGRNGAGKSTLLRTIAGVYPLLSGKIIRLGQISALFELGGMGGFLITGKQYALRWFRLNGIPRHDWPDLIEQIREFSELGERLDDRIYTYSAGMAARLYFSTATSVGHEIYLIDEILAVGDEHFQSKCWVRIRERLAHGVSGILVTHDWSAILRLSEQTYELENGRIKSQGDSEKVISNYLNLYSQLSAVDVAKFSHSCPISFLGISNKDWNCDIPIHIYKSESVWFTYSIEKLILGQEWQIIFFGEETLVGSSPGNYIARILVPNLPLPKGSYRLNLFLTGARSSNGGPRPGYDIKSWTSGNSIKLLIDGKEQQSLVNMPMWVEFE